VSALRRGRGLNRSLLNRGIAGTVVLSPKEVHVLWYYGAEGWPMKQVVTELDISMETGKSYLKRIRNKLRRRGVPADSRVDLYRAALIECVDLPWCLAARDELLRYLLTDTAPERIDNRQAIA
jgi:DNA-binding CsgD family transcriptional regulator